MKVPKLGMRIIKTAIAVLFTLLVSDLLVKDVLKQDFDSSIAVVVSLFTVQDTIKNTIQYGKDRFWGTLLGAAVGIALLSIVVSVPLGDTVMKAMFYILSSIGTMVVIYLCKCIKKTTLAALSAFILIEIMYGYSKSDPYLLAGVRLLETVIGIVIAILVNVLIAPVKSNNQSCPHTVGKLSTIVDNSHAQSAGYLPNATQGLSCSDIAESQECTSNADDDDWIASLFSEYR